MLGFVVSSFAFAGALVGGSSLSACATSSEAYFLEAGSVDGGGILQEGGADGGELADAHLSDAPRDEDGGTLAERIGCGSTFCRSDQKCVSNTCKYDCTGTSVPGDYATVSAAVTALAATGTDVTICLGAVQSGESVAIGDSGDHNKSIKIVATSPFQASLGYVTVGDGFGDVTLVGFGASSVAIQGTTKVTLQGLKVSTPNSVAVNIRSVSGGSPSSVLVDGCDIGVSGTSGYGIYVDASYTSTLHVSVRNSYIHGGQYGVYQFGANPSLSLEFVNNTIDKSQNGISLSPAPNAVVSYMNNIVSNNTLVGITVSAGASALTHANNALFGNTTNYASAAVDGVGYVKADCDLDMSTGVPQTKAGSPCRGAGKLEGAPKNDYWNAPRGPKIDLGAVQGP